MPTALAAVLLIASVIPASAATISKLPGVTACSQGFYHPPAQTGGTKAALKARTTSRAMIPLATLIMEAVRASAGARWWWCGGFGRRRRWCRRRW
jgi:hypothetical protein